jgi:hypothetical protein
MNTHTLPSFPLLVYECVTRYLLCVHFQGETPHWNRSTIECDERLLITRSTTKAIERGRHHLDVYKRRFKKKRLTDLSRRSICNPELETRQHSLATRNAMI